MKKENKIRVAMLWLFFGYFAILLCERILSVSLSIAHGVPLYGTPFHGFVYTMTFVSFASFFFYLGLRCRDAFKGLVRYDDATYETIDFRRLSFAAGLLLLSGMVHTEYTIPGIQFASYGLYIVALLLQVVLLWTKVSHKPLLLLSFLYLVAFSMAIPVVYPSALSYAPVFEALEGVSAVLLVMVFTRMVIALYEGKEDLFDWPFIVLAVVLDAALIALRFQEEINWFVLIFASLSALLFLAGAILKASLRKANAKNVNS